MSEDEGTLSIPAPQRTLLTLRREYLAALDTLLPLASRELRIFDPDLSQLGFESAQRVAMIERLLRRSRANRVCLAVHSPDYIRRGLPRLMSLLATFSASMAIHQTHGDAARVQDCFILCDELHFARRGVASHPRGVLHLHDNKEARGMKERFDQIWESSVLAVSPTQAGL
ncbi:MAG: hypothetical protein IT514_01475 [Burkholderiales bacterium]|nr:hypothetical protein [Burkholderiales bacterium]